MAATKLYTLGFLTETETAEIYGVVIPTLRNWRSREIGPAWHKRAGGVVYSIDDIQAHLKRNRVVPCNESAS